MTSQALPGATSLAICFCSWRLSTVGGRPPSTLTMNENCSGGTSSPMSMSGQTPCVWPVSKHSSSGLTFASFIAERRVVILPYVFGKTMSKTKPFRLSEYFA